MTDLISVIVPVYNVEKYLNRCVDSIINQTYKNLEIILIDDGSTDNSGKICDTYSQQDKRITVIHKNNGGQGSARNIGLDICKGDYIGFVDSDDWITPDMYEYLLNILKANNSDCASIYFKMTNGSHNINTGEENLEIWKGKEVLYNHLLEATTITGAHAVWRCLIKRDRVITIRFREDIINEDIPFKFLMLSNVTKMVNSHLVKYFYFQDTDSTTRGGLRKKDLNLLIACDELVDYAKNFPYLQYFAKVKRIRCYFSILAKAAYYGFSDEYSEASKAILINAYTKELKKNYWFLMKSSIPFSRKISISCMCINFNIFCKMISLYKIVR